VVGFAARELQAYVKKISGARLPIRAGVEPAPGLGRIVLGDCPQARAAGLDVSQLSRDGFFIKQAGDALYICGRDAPEARVNDVLYVWARSHQRGTLLGVYHLLREHLGVRWLFAGEHGEYVPASESISLPVLSLREEPVLKMRISSPLRGQDLQTLYGDRMKREAMLFLCRMGWSSWIMAKSHYFAYEHSASRWLATHPEYFALGRDGRRVLQLVPGQGWWLDFTNPELAHEVAADAVAYFRGQPASTRGLPEIQYHQFGFERESLAINPADTPIRSHVPACAAYRDETGDYSALAWFYYMIISKTVARECPGKLLSVWSYGDHARVPRSPERAPANVRAYIVNSGPFDWIVDRFRRRETRRMQEWFEFCSRTKMYLWVNFNIRACRPQQLGGVPSPMLRTIGPWMKAVAPYLDGIYFANSSDYDLIEASNTYLYYRLAWDPEQAPDAILSDFYARAYGPAAEHIRAVEAKCEDIWCMRITTPELNLGTNFLSVKAGLPTRMEVWEDIYTEAVVAELQAHMTQALHAARDTVFEKRVQLFNEHAVGTLAREREKFMGPLDLGDAMCLYAAPTAGQVVTPDGRLAEPAWAAARPAAMFCIDRDVRDPAPTEVRVLYGQASLHVGVVCHEPHVDRLRTAVTRHDDTDIWKDDDVELFLDPGITRKEYWQIMLNAAGTVADLRFADRRHDTAWESDVRCGITKSQDAWVAEMAVPYAALKVAAPKPGDRWAANVCRSRALTDPAPGERQLLTWSRLVSRAFNNPGEFGRIVFTRDGHPPEDATNLLCNGSFEDEHPRPWGGKNASVDPSASWEGLRSMRLTRLSAGEPAAVLQRLVGKIEPNREYRLSFLLKTEGVTPEPGREQERLAGVGAELYLKGEGWAPCPQRAVRGAQDWRKYAVSVKVGAKVTAQPTVRFRIRWATGTAWIDSVALREVGAE